MNPLHETSQVASASRSVYHVLVWPRWTSDDELFTLLTEFGPVFSKNRQSRLVLYANPNKDGTRADCQKRLQRILDAQDSFGDLNLTLLHCRLTTTVVHQLRRTISNALIVPSSMLPDRTSLYRVLGLPGLPDRSCAIHELEAWHADQDNVRLSWAPLADRSQNETSILIPENPMPAANWWARHDPKSEKEALPRLAVIVPYRDRAAHLAQLGPYLKHYLKDLPYQLFIIEQDDDKPFNRGKLLNIGVHLLHGCYDYFALHDVDLFPVESDYSYVEHPVHLAARVATNNFELLYETCMGGVMLVNREDYLAINGFSNSFWGWGAEDDDFYLRMRNKKRFPSRRDGLFDCLPHVSNAFQHDNYVDNVRHLEEMRRGEICPSENGLSTLSFSLNAASQTEWFTRFKVAT